MKFNQQMMEQWLKQPAMWKRAINVLAKQRFSWEPLFKEFDTINFITDNLPLKFEDLQKTVDSLVDGRQVLFSNHWVDHAINITLHNDTQTLEIENSFQQLKINFNPLGTDSYDKKTVFLTTYACIILLLLTNPETFDKVAYQIAMASEDLEAFIRQDLEVLVEGLKHSGTQFMWSGIQESWNHVINYYNLDFAAEDCNQFQIDKPALWIKDTNQTVAFLGLPKNNHLQHWLLATTLLQLIAIFN